MRFLGFFALISLAEMATFFWVQSWIGLGWALLLAVATALIGSYLVRRAGLSVIRRFRGKLNEGTLPGREMSDGAAILVSGAFLISPGFITDILGFLLLLPVVRAAVFRFTSARFSPQIAMFSSGRDAVRRYQRGRRLEAEDVIDIEGHEVE